MVQTIRLSDTTYNNLRATKSELIFRGFGKGLTEREQDFDWVVSVLITEALKVLREK